jgi:hypothetical protein
MDSVRTQGGMLALITSQTDEITRDIQVELNNSFIQILKYSLWGSSSFLVEF